MGENTSAAREGPFNQGARRYVRDQDDGRMDSNETEQVRGARTNDGKTEEPLEGGAALLQEESGMETAAIPDQSAAKTQEPAVVRAQPKTPKSRGSRIQPPGTPYKPHQPTLADLTTIGTNTSTIAANNFLGVLADRIYIVASPGHTSDGPRDIDQLARKLLAKQITRLHSQDEKAAVLARVKELKGYEKNMTSQQKANQNPEKAAKGHAYFQPLAEGVRSSLVDKMVKGVYDGEQVLAGQKYKQPVLNTVARATMMNGTYLSSDGDRLLQKVRSLLPVASTPQARAGGAQKQALRK